MGSNQKSVLVTGAGGGIGKAIVERMASDGATLVVADQSEQLLAPLLNIADRWDVPIHLVPGDLTQSDYCDTLPSRARKLAGSLDVVINNAGIIRRGNVLETSDEDWALSMAVNVESVFRISRSAIKLMKAQGGGAIVNVASCWGLYPGPDHLAYCTTKSAVTTMSKCMGRDHARDGIRVNAVCPNEVNTPMLRTGFERRGFDPDSAVEALGETIPVGRIAEPEDIADVIAFLASEDARYITGTTLEVNGGKPVY